MEALLVDGHDASSADAVPHESVTFLKRNIVQRTLSAIVLAPAIIYFIYRGAKAAVITLGTIVVAICLFEYSWLALRIRHRAVTHYLCYLSFHPDDDPLHFLDVRATYSAPLDVRSTAASRLSKSKVWWRVYLIAGALAVPIAATATGLVYATMRRMNDIQLDYLVYAGGSFFVAGVCAFLTPSPVDAVVLLLEVVGFSLSSLNNHFCSRRPNTKCFLTVDSGTALCVVFVPMVALRMTSHRHIVDAGVAIALDIVSLVYIPMMFRMLIDALGVMASGQEVAMRYLFIVWGCDCGAYAAGMLLTAWGYKGSPRTKLAPHISPNKDIEGTIGGIVMAVGASIVANKYFDVADQSSEYGSYISTQLKTTTAYWQLIVFAVVGACFSRYGDLFASLLKRLADVKDTGRLIPGHGGMLDRVDGLIFMSAILAIFHRAMFPLLYEYDKRGKLLQDVMYLSPWDQKWLLNVVTSFNSATTPS
ncbi:Aste57867_14837 [Aphanomyces stellatus]|uniref:Phosphatidate cytidylyltransferase n=1 Tax=Aphanomyces stellatus TaxID=120398 RepID=A0A485L200_9STRA|nr:hypothetical protein As57867_014781 [Aphanomyces stellatus]VFT91655.1 Aste57867_14837 [Aphanomyces stellatus]